MKLLKKRWELGSLTRNEQKAIHEASVDILWNCGIRVEQKAAADIFEQAGAWVSKEGKLYRIKLPRHLVEESMKAAPGSFTMHARNPENSHEIKDGSLSYVAGFGEHIKIIDGFKKEPRSTTKQDLFNICKIQDKSGVFKMANRAACSGDKSSQYQSIHNFHAMLQGTSKHCILGFNGGKCTKIIMDMAQIVAGGPEELKKAPPLTCFVSPTSPLCLVSEATEAMIEAIPRGVGIAITPMILSGASGPATPLGTAIQHNCEFIMTITFAQCIRKGATCIMTNCSTMMDLRKAIAPVGVVEKALNSLITVSMGDYYDIPTWAGAGATDSKLPDAQMGCDFSLTALPATLAGANVVYGLGAVDSLITFDYAALMIGIEQAERFIILRHGISFDPLNETVALIKEITGTKGSNNFLGHKHTFEHMRSMSTGELFNRDNREKWMKNGPIDISERAYLKAASIIAEHEPDPMPLDIASALETIINQLENG
ncbi:trimethylamine methyltransferase family protein [Desulfobacula sp.]|uniref:trimethylamine methyltransferase family protein n=1 Tax=Desulfobacula sp. TaxID=2593537 RepID=UPI0025BE15A1|nr:trimethylamine methyltransferase family protein [Desulfobacula sp.]MBC2704667.1 trimethylamine methyltransferase family protein [Desulfobacula sp.]